WLVFPLVLALVCLGCGLLLEAGGGTRLPQPLVLPAGLAAVIVIAQVTTATVPRATTPVVVAAALAGIALRPPWRVTWRALRWPPSRRRWPPLPTATRSGAERRS